MNKIYEIIELWLKLIDNLVLANIFLEKALLFLCRSGGDFLETQPIGLGYKKCKHQAGEHEGGKYGEQKREARVPLAVVVLQLKEAHLWDDGAQFAGGRRYAVRCRSEPRGERLAGYHERGRVRPEVVKELRQREYDHKQDDRVVFDAVEERRQHGQYDCQQGEAEYLYGLSADSIDQEHGHPVAGYEAQKWNDQIAQHIVEQHWVDLDGGKVAHVVANVLVDFFECAREADRLNNDRRIHVYTFWLT